MRPDILNPLFAPVSSLEGIGPKLEKVLTKLFHGTVDGSTARIVDLIFHQPHSIIDRTNQPKISEAPEGSIVTLKVHVDQHQPSPRSKKSIPYKVNVHDETGELTLVFFRSHAQYLEKMLPIGEQLYVSGKIEYINGRPNMVHPDHIISEKDFALMPLIEPVYPATAGIAQKILQKSIRASVEKIPQLEEWADDALVKKENWSDFQQAATRLHNPRDLTDLDPRSTHRRRLAHDEFLSGQLALALMRERMRKQNGKARSFNGQLANKIIANFKWPLTSSQNKAIEEINSDIKKPERMLRLLQGDVGSGKTIVALSVMASVIEAGSQAAIMAPTEILARQHLKSISSLCETAGIKAEILTSREKGKVREAILNRLASGETDILIGTHALFQDQVKFKDLGLAVIDEQHRFGVHQRLALGDKGTQSDVLVMTATPIPRTLVMTWYGDMDVSQLTEKPAGRQEIKTTALSKEKLSDLVARIKVAVGEGKKIYWVCPLVEDSEEVDATSAEERYQFFKPIFKDKVGIIHGRMNSEEKDAAMMAFKNSDTRILVATTVIEVGVDVPDATILVLEHAERFGLAQMHQLRGRVGRSDQASSCILLYKTPLGEIAKTRIEAMRQTNDGFILAEKDLELRGEGEILGTRQSGTPGFNLASTEHHADILEMARDEAKIIMLKDPSLTGKKGEALRILLYLFGQDQAIRLLKS